MSITKELDELPVRERFRRVLQGAAHEHEGWVDNRGLHTGQPGPLDELIRELETCLDLARRLKAEAEEDS